MLRDILLRIYESLTLRSVGNVATPRPGPQEIQAELISVLSRQTEHFFTDLESMVVRVHGIAEGANSLPVIQVLDRRLDLGGPQFVVEYQFEPNRQQIVLTLSHTCESGGPKYENVGELTFAFRTAFLNYVLIPEAFLRQLQQDMARAEPSEAGGAWQERSIFRVEYDVANLPTNDRLEQDLIGISGCLQLATYHDVASRSPVGGMGFTSWISFIGRLYGTYPVVKEKTAHVGVWYGTNRKAERDASGQLVGFGVDRDAPDQLHFGRCRVAIPRCHAFGSTRSNWWVRLLRGYDDQLVLEAIHELPSREEFVSDIQDHLSEKAFKFEDQVLVYIHGYNIDFRRAAIRTAQMGADLKIRTLAFFSWPSRGNPRDYIPDLTSAEESEEHFIAFLKTLSDATGGRRINLLVNSMGNRMVLRSIDRIAKGAMGIRFGLVLMAAADVSANVFRNQAPSIPRLSSRVTHYVSGRDTALAVAERVHKAPSAGSCPPHVIVEGIDTIEVTEVDLSLLGHSFFAEAEPVLYDMYISLRGEHPEDRPRIHAEITDDGEGYWVLSG